MPFRDKSQARTGFRKRQEFSEPGDGFKVGIEDRQEEFTFDPPTALLPSFLSAKKRRQARLKAVAVVHFGMSWLLKLYLLKVRYTRGAGDTSPIVG